MKARHGFECEDKRKPSKHGKDIADGDAHAVGGMVKRSFNDDYGKGTQNLVRHLAYKYPAPKMERRTRYYRIEHGNIHFISYPTNYIIILIVFHLHRGIMG